MSDTKTYTVTDTGGHRGEGNVHTVVAADYHRNGVGGAGFIVALVDTVMPDFGPEPRRFVLTWFPEYDEDGEERDYSERVSVVGLDEMVKGNIYMHPAVDPVTGKSLPETGGNAWRGADNWAVVLPVIRRWMDDRREAQDALWKAERTKMQQAVSQARAERV